ncbi:ALDH-like protein [Glarea lozoyensis ATCC 20868]|uniref:aldehyde dehydrogenase (NAD(+)) n=1 Tax=Glarea lozoyensis (strain ATCC 20868 / MF5171) TaxID=1116229 RepID=S3DF62_GLAL2|nr:ALDH-like protein [Glarea lozoyensis ATCC 20868]EPE36390.1 ALDH-like protein [Glarea lozoyensis ATCC 20868]
MSTTSAYKLDNFESFYNIIDNELVPTAKTRRAVDPSNEELLAEVPVSTQQDVDRAVAAAQAAFPSWRDLSQDERAVYLTTFVDAIDAHQQEFAQLLGKEAGKPPQGVGIELYLLSHQIHETLKFRLTEEQIEDTDERRIVQRYIPIGVGVGIVPWNFPMLLGIIKLVSALLTGNTFIWKPSPYSPYTALKLGELGAKIFPKGVFNVLSGDEDLGPLLTAHPGVAKISFTGSVATGKKVMQACASTLKRVTLELGGNDAAIVMPDADLAMTVPKVATMAYFHSGQVCFCIKRVYVHEAIYDAFIAAIVEFVKSLKSGGPSDAEAVLGPIQNSMQYAKLLELYSQVSKQDLKVAYGGEAASSQSGSGFYLPPTVIDNPPEDSKLVVEEQFGPIVPILKWSDEEDVIRRANASSMGLGGSVWSKDIVAAERLTRRLEAGTVWVNAHFEVGPQAAFGGHKNSGIGVESGLDGLKGWCNAQVVWIKK